MTAKLKPFTQNDWLGWAGAGENPLIAEFVDNRCGHGKIVVIVAYK